MQLQGELNFDSGSGQDGYNKWVAVRQLTAHKAAEKLNLPVEHPTEVWLRGGIRLHGTLRLTRDLLFIEEERIRSLPLEVDGVSFTFAEIESCVRMDEDL